MTTQPTDDQSLKQFRRSNIKGWWEEYGCGCVSDTVARKKDLTGYCPTHGNNRRNIFPELKSYNT